MPVGMSNTVVAQCVKVLCHDVKTFATARARKVRTEMFLVHLVPLWWFKSILRSIMVAFGKGSHEHASSTLAATYISSPEKAVHRTVYFIAKRGLHGKEN